MGFLGRSLFAFIFIFSAANKLMTFGDDGGPTLAYMKPKLDAAKGLLLKTSGFDLNAAVPLEDKHYLAVAIALELLGGLLFMMNSELGAHLLVGFLFFVTPIMHNFWTIKDQNSSTYLVEQIMFCKNLSMLGALLFYQSMKREINDLKDAVAINAKKTN